MGKAAFGDFAQGIGSTVQQFVLLGNTGPHALRKVTAQTLASLSSEASVKALMALADGFVHLFTNPAQSAADFTAAAIYGGIAGVAAVAGRAVAGNIFKDEQNGTGAGPSGGVTSGGTTERDRTIREGRTGSASDPFVIEQSRNPPSAPPIVIHLEARAVTHNEPGTLTEHVINVVSSDPRVREAVASHVEKDLHWPGSRLHAEVEQSMIQSWRGYGRFRDMVLNYI